jgi:hypothetical protein
LTVLRTTTFQRRRKPVHPLQAFSINSISFQREEGSAMAMKLEADVDVAEDVVVLGT